MESYRGRKPRANGKTYIQVAHNAYTFNRHLELLDAIRQYQDENVRVVVPLSYGNDWYNQQDGYITTVQKKAQDYFGDKAVVLHRLMPAEEYSEALCNIDVSVYGARRQNALGNIFRSLYVGNKVFLPKDNPVYSYFTDNGIALGCTDDIEKMSFEEFIRPLSSDRAVAWIREQHHPAAAAVYWRELFEALRRKKRERRMHRSPVKPGSSRSKRRWPECFRRRRRCPALPGESRITSTFPAMWGCPRAQF